MLDEAEFDYADLNPEQKRALNIQRQQRYLDILLGKPAQEPQQDIIRTGCSAAISFDFDKKNLYLVNLQEAFPCREYEISLLLKYMEYSHFGLPNTILVSGPTGSGKTAIVEACASRSGFTYCSVLCSGYSNWKQLLRAIIISIQSALLVKREKGKNEKTSYVLLDESKVSSAFEDFAVSIASIVSPIVLFLDRIEFADTLQAGLTMKLLALPETSGNSRVKLIAASSAFLSFRCFRLELWPYEDIHIERILLKWAKERCHEDLSVIRVIKGHLSRLLDGTRHCNELWNMILGLSKLFDQHGEVADKASFDSLIKKTLAEPYMQNRESSSIALLGTGWIGALSHTSKCILLAAFCASNNSKKSDAFTFGDAKKGRRKRKLIDGDEVGIDMIDKQETSSNAFSFERLTGIFVQASN